MGGEGGRVGQGVTSHNVGKLSLLKVYNVSGPDRPHALLCISASQEVPQVI